MLDTALDYLSKGWSVFPLRNKRSPVIPWKQFQTRLPTETEIRSWDWSAGYIGLALGEVSGVIRIDAEGPVPDIWELTPTYTFTTPSGGFGYLYRHTPGVKTEVLWTGEGHHEEFRIQSAGAYTVLPPSPGYTLVQDAVANPPKWLYDRGASEVIRALERETRPWISLPDLGTLRGALDSLSQKRCDDYTSWWQVGAALHNLGHEHLNIWIEWSKKSDKFQEGACERTWSQYSEDRERPLTWRSIYRWAKEDNPAWKSASKYEPFTDQAGARVFARAATETMRFCKDWDEWVCWNGSRWERNAFEHADRLQKKLNIDRRRETSLRLLRLPEDKDEAQNRIKKLTKILSMCNQMQSRNRIRAVIDLARTEEEMTVSADAFDQQPWLLNCPNGTVNLRTMEVMPHIKEAMLTQLCPTEWDPGSQCPRWELFMEEVFDGNRELVVWMKKFLGYCMTGITTEHILPIWYGEGRNGKGTIVRTMKDVLGGDFVAEAPSGFLAKHKNEPHHTVLMELYKRRFVVDQETDSVMTVNEALAKKLTGGDDIKGRWLYHDYVQYPPTHKLAILTNCLPNIQGMDPAIWMRIHLIPFLVSFAGREDRWLNDTLRTEAAGILWWMAQGCMQWQEDGLVAPETVVQATAVYRGASNSVKGWLEECAALDSESRILKRIVGDAYRTWCRNRGVTPLNPKAVGGELNKHGIVSDGHNYYKGVKLM